MKVILKGIFLSFCTLDTYEKVYPRNKVILIYFIEPERRRTYVEQIEV